MADRLKPLLLVVTTALAQPLQAQPTAAVLPDPTRPPLLSEAAPSAAGAPAGGVVAGGAVAATLVLSSVLVPVRGKPTAIIDGRSFGVGDMVGEARILRIAETGVTLQGPQGRQVLALTPGIEKKTTRAAADARRPGKTTP